MKLHGMVQHWRAGLVALSIVAGGACPPAAAQTGDEIIARLGTTDIRAADLGAFLQSLDPMTRQQAASDPQLLSRLVRVELARIAVLREAKDQHWDAKPNVVRQIERARDQVIVSSYLASVTAPPGNYPSDADIQAAYEKNCDRFMLPRQYHLAEIFVAVPADADKKRQDDAQKRVLDMVKRLKAKTAKFADLAANGSDLRNAASSGGDLGWLPETQLVPEVKSAVEGMGKNDISDAIKTADGWHIVQLVDTKPAGPRPLAEVRDAIVQYLRQQKMAANEQTYLAQLLDRDHAAVNELALSKLLDIAK